MKNRLEELRKQRAIRQEDLAQALGVSRQTVISLEKGKYNPSLALAFKLARYFGLPIEAIFDDSDESTAAITNLAPHSGADIGL
ncbi:MAG: helix-turn-helix transcriptional regulator [Christensenellales bacterium]